MARHVEPIGVREDGVRSRSFECGHILGVTRARPGGSHDLVRSAYLPRGLDIMLRRRTALFPRGGPTRPVASSLPFRCSMVVKDIARNLAPDTVYNARLYQEVYGPRRSMRRHVRVLADCVVGRDNLYT